MTLFDGGGELEQWLGVATERLAAGALGTQVQKGMYNALRVYGRGRGGGRVAGVALVVVVFAKAMDHGS
jgi:hypothetical protein